MSGWDVSSTPTWGSQDGPDETQAFTASQGGTRGRGQDFGAADFDGGYPGENMAGGPPAEYFGQEYGQDHDVPPGGFPQRTPGQSFQDLPRRDSVPGRRGGGRPADGGYGQGNGYGQENGYGQGDGYGRENGYGREPGYGQADGYGQENGYGQGDGYGRENGYGQEPGYGQDNAFGQEWGGNGAGQADSWGRGSQDDGSWGRSAGRPGAPWDERPQRDAGFGGEAGFADADGGGFGRQDFGRQPEGFSAQDYAGQDFPSQSDRGGQAPMEFGRQERDMAARNDPALQDFFSPSGNGAGFPGQAPGPGWSGGQPGRDRFRPADEEVDWTGRPKARPAADEDVDWTGRPKARPAADEDVDWTGRLKARPAADEDVDWTGRPRGQRPASRRDDDDDEGSGGGIGMKGLVAIGAVVVVVIAAAAYMFLHKSGGGTPAASNTPSAAASSPAAKPSGSAATGTGAAAGGAAAAAYTLVSPLPSTAGGYPVGQDPNDLANAKGTAQQVVTAVNAGGGGTVKGTPEAAAYTLPASQVITFVGYQGTFTPAKIATILKSLGSDPNTYSAGPHGGELGCANTTTAPSGAVCVWATSSTLGITEFYSATGPETLVNFQSKGASDTVKLRADVEKKA
jgi:hypothetical protein